MPTRLYCAGVRQFFAQERVVAPFAAYCSPNGHGAPRRIHGKEMVMSQLEQPNRNPAFCQGRRHGLAIEAVCTEIRMPNRVFRFLRI